jgi:hypothetical protein
MNALIIKSVFLILAFIALPVIVVALAVLPRIIPQELLRDTRFVLIVTSLFAAYWVIIFFWIPKAVIVLHPNPQVTPMSEQVLVERLQTAFSQKGAENETMFSIVQDRHKVLITWSNTLQAFQITSAHGIKKKVSFVLSLDEAKHTAFLVMKEMDATWDASTARLFDFSFSYNVGLFAEISTTWAPSLQVDDAGNISFNVEKLSYNSDEIFQPIQKILADSGWTLRSGFIQNDTVIVLAGALAGLVMFCLMYFLLFKVID